MADHVREQIATAVLAAVTGLTTTGSHVYRDRDTDERPLQSTELPGLTFDDDGDPSETISIGVTRTLERRMRIQLGAHVRAGTGYSAKLNLILKEIEVALAGASLGGAKSANLVEVQGREAAEGGDTPAVRQFFVFELVYYTAHNAPDVAL